MGTNMPSELESRSKRRMTLRPAKRTSRTQARNLLCKFPCGNRVSRNHLYYNLLVTFLLANKKVVELQACTKDDMLLTCGSDAGWGAGPHDRVGGS